MLGIREVVNVDDTLNHTPERHRRLQREQDLDQNVREKIIPTRLDVDHILDHPPNERQLVEDLEVASEFRYPRNADAELVVWDLFVHVPDTSLGVFELLGKIRLSFGAVVVV